MSDKLQNAVRALLVAYPRQEFPAPTQKLYLQLLGDLDPDVLEIAVLDLITKSTFLPSISEIRAAVGSLYERSSGRLDAYSAWDKVCSEIIRVGWYGAPELDDMTSRALKAIGGWRMTCQSENMTADRSRFVSAYETFLKREREEGVELPMVKHLLAGLTTERLLRGGQEVE